MVSSGIATGESGRPSTGTGSSKSSDVQVTDNVINISEHDDLLVIM